jgi:hypothetical protein
MTLYANSHHSAWMPGPQAGMDSLSGGPASAYARFASPWMSHGVVSGSVTIRQMMDFGLMLWKFDPTWQRAMNRVVSYFLTDLEFYDPGHTGDLKEEDINSYREVLETDFRVRSFLQQAMLNYLVYGNLILSNLPPIRRRLQCRNPSCRLIQPLEVVVSPDNKQYQFRYHAKGVRFHAKCPVCGYHGDWDVFDMKADYRQNSRIQMWEPKDFLLHHDPLTDNSVLTWEIPARIRERVENGDPLLLASFPQSLLRSLGEGKDYRFSTGSLLHLKHPAPLGLDMGGWGVPPAVYAYGMSRYVFMLRKMNEALASDYMVPVRLISPSRAGDHNGTSFMDTAVTTDMSDWNTQVRNIWAEHRKDPASVHTIGFPVEYQILGGEGKSLVPGEILRQAEDMQLNAMGVPPQLYRSDLNVQVAPMAARLFEADWQHIVQVENDILSWLVSKITPELGWKPCGVRMSPSKIADNMDQLMLLLQMWQAQAVSPATILNRLGLSETEEIRKQLEGAATRLRMETEQQKQLDEFSSGVSALQQATDQQRMAADPSMQAQMQGGPAAPQGMPAAGPAPGGAMPPAMDPLGSILSKIDMFGSSGAMVRPQDMTALAEEAAAVLIYTPEITRRQALRDIAAKNEQIHDLILARMGKQRGDLRSTAYAQAMTQAQTGAPPM